MPRSTRILFVTLISIAVLGVGVLGFALVRMLTSDPATGGSFGEPLIGGSFTLVDGTGATRTDDDFRGRLMLVYFGFTYCPDVCPTELQAMGQAVDLLGEKAESVQPIFITIDPERDTPQMVGQYVESFHPRMIGLTGTPEQVAAAAKAYRVYYRKAEVEGSSDYLMDHSSIVYLMGPDGKFLTHFSHGTSPQDMAKGISKHL
ncbi:cytochrome oxidase Cu insertion factor (SCO1/SenC/PrrC family) [Constrictibacter sp. MBR-5]|jgi:protein SCO1/2|uniref:SCO family protein n=1 Tax=Constrictibacter sp. MBR-5 TaxID=3156467 RepID=UPI003391DE13